ncbi:STAS domain-containing protein [Nonomuraea terrae]|uniref:STAS domain-containing protein n=1 Tax=Nonomuraea terrae TaxID=2530383 RepID=UPI0037A680CB
MDKHDQPQSLQLATHSAAWGAVLALRGSLDYETSARLGVALERMLGEHDLSTVVLDLSELEFCDSSGIGALAIAWKRMRRDGRHLALAGAHGLCGRALQRTGLHQIFAQYPTLAEADAALSARR